MREAIQRLLERHDLSAEEARRVMEEVMRGAATPAQIAGLLIALRAKGETAEEIAAFAGVMRRFCERIHPRVRGRLLDTCGTGGDRVKTFNVSTIAAFVTAGAGAYVAKHGGRAVSSRCGSADLLQTLGFSLEVPPSAVEKAIEEVGIGFMFAPVFHPAMKHAAGPRREIGVSTVFNLLGPLTNPAGADAQLIGVYDPSLSPKMASALKALGAKRALIVHGVGGVDEVSVMGPTLVADLNGEIISQYEVHPQDFGVAEAKVEDIVGSSPEENAVTTLRILCGEDQDNRAKTNLVLVNSAAGLVAAGGADSLHEGMEMARESIGSGRAYEKLLRLLKHTGGDVGRLEELEARR